MISKIHRKKRFTLKIARVVEDYNIRFGLRKYHKATPNRFLSHNNHKLSKNKNKQPNRNPKSKNKTMTRTGMNKSRTKKPQNSLKRALCRKEGKIFKDF